MKGTLSVITVTTTAVIFCGKLKQAEKSDKSSTETEMAPKDQIILSFKPVEILMTQGCTNVTELNLASSIVHLTPIR